MCLRPRLLRRSASFHERPLLRTLAVDLLLAYPPLLVGVGIDLHDHLVEPDSAHMEQPLHSGDDLRPSANCGLIRPAFIIADTASPVALDPSHSSRPAAWSASKVAGFTATRRDTAHENASDHDLATTSRPSRGRRTGRNDEAITRQMPRRRPHRGLIIPRTRSAQRSACALSRQLAPQGLQEREKRAGRPLARRPARERHRAAVARSGASRPTRGG